MVIPSVVEGCIGKTHASTTLSMTNRQNNKGSCFRAFINYKP